MEEVFDPSFVADEPELSIRRRAIVPVGIPVSSINELRTSRGLCTSSDAGKGPEEAARNC
jgi:hypothetical protein